MCTNLAGTVFDLNKNKDINKGKKKRYVIDMAMNEEGNL